MAEVQLQKIKALYGEIFGILSQLAPAHKASYYPVSIGEHYNSVVDELSRLTKTDYSRHRLTNADISEYGDGDEYDSQIARAKIGSVVARLENEYNFGHQNISKSAPILNITNMNQLQVTIVNIDQLIKEVEDLETKKLLSEIKDAIKQKDEDKTKGLLKALLDRSFEVFLRVLPWILEQWSR